MGPNRARRKRHAMQCQMSDRFGLHSCSYETAATLLLRGVLKPDNPAHAAILAQFDGGWDV